MSDSKEALERRRDEILEQLETSGRDLQVPLDRDPEEQSIEVEQQEVSITMVENLRKELADIEDRLASVQ